MKYLLLVPNEIGTDIKTVKIVMAIRLNNFLSVELNDKMFGCALCFKLDSYF